MSSTTLAGVRKWISRSEASESELPPKEHRLPDGWDEEDIILDADIAPIKGAKQQSKQQQEQKQQQQPAKQQKQQQHSEQAGAGSGALAAVRKWISTSQASESDLPPKEHRLPAGWTEKDIIVDGENNKTNGASPKKAATGASPSKKGAPVAAPQQQQVSSPGVFPDGFFASPKTKQPTTDFPKTTPAATKPAAKFNQAEEDARLKTNAAPGVLVRLAGFFMRKKDGANGTVQTVASVANATDGAVASPSPKKLTGSRREREESSSSEESSSTGGDLAAQLVSMSAKKLEASKELTVGDLKDYARENGIKIPAKAKKGDLVAACQKFAKNDAAASGASPSKPRASVSAAAVGASPTKSSTVAVVAASPVKAQQQKKPRAAYNPARLYGDCPLTINKNDEPQPEWTVVQMKQWAKDNKVTLGKDLFLKTEILDAVLAAYDKMH